MTVRWNSRAANFTNDPRLGRELLKDGWKVAAAAVALAPKDTGRGAGSIHPELVRTPDGPEVRVSWDRAHFYMGFAETGTMHQRPTPFLRPAAYQFR